MKIIIKILLLTFLFTSCASSGKEYRSEVLKSYRKYKKQENLLKTKEKKKSEDKYTRYKAKLKYSPFEDRIFFLIRELKELDFTKKDQNIIMNLCVKYRDGKWVYMNAVEFIDEASEENLKLSFETEDRNFLVIDDGVTMIGGVYERAAFNISDEEAKEIIKILNGIDVKLKLYSNYDDRTYTRKIKEKEKEKLRILYDFYVKRKSEIQKNLGEKEKESREELIKTVEEEFAKDEEKESLEKEAKNPKDEKIEIKEKSLKETKEIEKKAKGSDKKNLDKKEEIIE